MKGMYLPNWAETKRKTSPDKWRLFGVEEGSEGEGGGCKKMPFAAFVLTAV